MRGGDVSPAVEGAGSGSRGSTQAESRPTNKKKMKHTVTKDKSTTTGNKVGKSRTTVFSDKIERT